MGDWNVTINAHSQGVLTPEGMVTVSHKGPCTEENCRAPYREIEQLATVRDHEIFQEDSD